MEKEYFKNRFKDKTMIVTGGARGIGKAVCLRAANESAEVVIVDKLEKEGNEVLNSIIDNGGKAMFINLDLTNEDNCRYLIDETVKRFHKIDIAVNNLGIMGNPNPLHQLPKKDMDYVMLTNFYTVFFCCKYEIQQFMKQNTGGVIVNTSSISGVIGVPGNPAYSASKHAINGLTKNIALDYAKYNIRINSVNPATTATPLVEEAMEYVKSKIAEAKANGIDLLKAHSGSFLKTKNMLERDLTAEEQAASILYLASDDATHMTGTTLQTDGGWTSF